MVHIKIIRHAERLDHTDPLRWFFYFGYFWFDSPLTDNGHRAAREKGREIMSAEFQPKYIYTSPYRRTISTATEIQRSFPSAEISIMPLLSENQSYWQHCTAFFPLGIPTTYESLETQFAFPETYTSFITRCEFILEKILQKKCDVIIITHSELIKGFLTYIQNKHPDIILEPKNISYLSTLSFDYDPVAETIIESSVKLV